MNQASEANPTPAWAKDLPEWVRAKGEIEWFRVRNWSEVLYARWTHNRSEFEIFGRSDDGSVTHSLFPAPQQVQVCTHLENAFKRHPQEWIALHHTINNVRWVGWVHQSAVERVQGSLFGNHVDSAVLIGAGDRVFGTVSDEQMNPAATALRLNLL